MQLSTIIACRNEIHNLPSLLVSIENQTYKPDEVIFVDDNSTDETYNFLINYSKKHNNIKVIKKFDPTWISWLYFNIHTLI